MNHWIAGEFFDFGRNPVPQEEPASVIKRQISIELPCSRLYSIFGEIETIKNAQLREIIINKGSGKWKERMEVLHIL
jgi:hypothetical protein